MKIELIEAGRGPRFFLVEGEEYFTYLIDARTQTGPFPTTDVERAKYPDAYAAFRSEHVPSEPKIDRRRKEHRNPS
jgi:hypothetical protein